MLGAVALAAVTLACSEPPTKERQQAEGAIAAARAAGAATYASAELSAAEKALVDYDAAVAQRDYRLALRLAVEARNGAYEAAKRAADEKAALRGRAEQVVATLDELLRAAGGRPLPSTRSAADRMRGVLKHATATLQKARSLIDEERYNEALGLATPAVEQLRSERALPHGAAPQKAP